MLQLRLTSVSSYLRVSVFSRLAGPYNTGWSCNWGNHLLDCSLQLVGMAAATESTTYAASLDDIKAAAQRISGQAHVTSVLTCSTLDRLAGGHKLHFKCEVFQKG